MSDLPDADDLLDMMSSPVKPMGGTSSARLEADYRPLFDKWKADPTPQNAGGLVKAVQPVIDSVVRPLGNSPVIRGRARQMALRAFSTYDPARASLRTHLMHQFQGLRRISAQHDSPIRVPERVMLQRQTLQDAAAELQDQLGRPPSDNELADHSGLSVARIRHIRQYQRPLAEGTFDRPNADDEGGSGGPAVEGSTPQHVLDEFVYGALPPRDQLIFDYALGRNGYPKLNTQQIAAELGVTPGAISQRLAAIQRRYAAVEDMRLFGE